MNKVLLVIHTPPPYGGGEVQAQNLKNYFKDKPNYHIYDYSSKNKTRSDWSRVKLKVIFKGVVWILKVIYLIIKINPDIIYFTLPKSFAAFIRNISIIPVAKMWNVKIYGELPGSSFPFLEKHNTLKRRLSLFFLNSIDDIRFLSPRIAEYHRNQHGITNSSVILNGIQMPQNFSLDEKPIYKKNLSLIYIGSLEFSKGLFNSIQAIKLCEDQNLTVHLNLVGDWCYKSEKETIFNYINEYKLDNLITFHGTLIGQDKWDLFRTCAVLVHPTYWDGVPLTILESLGLGIPVISTETGGIPDTIEHMENGLILKENTPKKIFEALKYLNENRNVILRMSNNNKRLFEKRYEVTIFLKRMEDWFQEKSETNSNLH